jgi:predicted acylesterase/phospholipase RssA
MSIVATTTSTRAAKTAYVLAGGGSLGAVQVGMLKALAAHGLKPDFIVGASAGAINGAYAAARPDVEGISELERLWTTMRIPVKAATVYALKAATITVARRTALR